MLAHYQGKFELERLKLLTLKRPEVYHFTMSVKVLPEADFSTKVVADSIEVFLVEQSFADRFVESRIGQVFQDIGPGERHKNTDS